MILAMLRANSTYSEVAGIASMTEEEIRRIEAEVNSPRTSDDSQVVLLILVLAAAIIAEGGIICAKRIKSNAARKSEK